MQIQENEILWCKRKEGAIIPSKREEDAGYDIYACFDEAIIVIPSLENALIPTGISSAMHPSKMARLAERGSTGKCNMGIGAGVIDSGYRGEWFVMVRNLNDRPLIISNVEEGRIQRGLADMGFEDFDSYVFYSTKKAIAQALIQEVPVMNSREESEYDLSKYSSERGETNLGASNK